MAAKKYIKIIGTRYYFDPCFGRGVVDTKEPLEILAIVNENRIQYIKVGKDYCLQQGTPNITNHVFSLRFQKVIVEKLLGCTDDEIAKLHRAIDMYGMYWGEYEVITWYKPLMSESFFKKEKFEGLLWKSKDEFVLEIDGKPTKYKDLDFELANGGHGEHVVLSGDNGYSHYWSDTTDWDRVRKLVDEMFKTEYTTNEIKDKKNWVFGMKRVNASSIFGWQFNDYGRLVIRTYSGEKHERVSVVSNT